MSHQSKAAYDGSDFSFYSGATVLSMIHLLKALLYVNGSKCALLPRVSYGNVHTFILRFISIALFTTLHCCVMLLIHNMPENS